MTRVASSRAVDEAQYVKTSVRAGGVPLVQVWYGGTQVRMFEVHGIEAGERADQREAWYEVDVWTVSGEKGRPVEQVEIEELMEQHAAVAAEEVEER